MKGNSLMTDPNLKKEYLNAKRRLFDRYYDNLNDRQREAVYTTEGPLLVLAGAGSGKTTVLVTRLAHIIRYGKAYSSERVPEDITADSVRELIEALKYPKDEIGAILERFSEDTPKPWQTLAVTFTNKAAGEIKNRIAGVLGEDAAGQIMAGTFHSVCVRILRSWGDQIGYDRSFTICDSEDTKKQIQLCMKQLSIDDKTLPVKAVQYAISSAKEKLIDAVMYEEEAGDDAKRRLISKIYTLYSEKLRSQNLIDFDDIIMQTVRLMKESKSARESLQKKYRYILVDEFQDTNVAQLELTRLLSEVHNNIMAVGDDDQSIYRFRGAVIENILNYDKTFEGAGIIRLEQNYRSTKTILDAANAVIANNEGRLGKKLWTEGEQGEPVRVRYLENQNDEARYIAEIVNRGVANGRKYKDYACLYRQNSQSRSLENAFAKSSIPYRLVGGTRFYERMEIKDIIAYLAVINNPNDDLRLRRIINTPRRGIGDKSIQVAEALAYEEGCPMLEFLRRAKRYPAIAPSTSNQMSAFVYMFDTFRDAAATIPVSELIEKVYVESGYKGMLEELPDIKERDERSMNIGELISAAKSYEEANEEPTLAGFLEDVALVSDVDKYDDAADAVVLMTIHSSKGLEFNTVFIPGMEENIFPSFQTVLNPDEMEEERRLAYVAYTRAKKELYLIHVRDRMLNGRTGSNDISRFAEEIPEELCYKDEEAPGDSELRAIRQRPVKQKPVNHFVEETSKPSPALAASAQKNNEGEREKFAAGDTVKHMTFGVGLIISAKDMGSDTLYEIAFEKVGTKKLMATYAKLKRV